MLIKPEKRNGVTLDFWTFINVYFYKSAIDFMKKVNLLHNAVKPEKS